MHIFPYNFSKYVYCNLNEKVYKFKYPNICQTVILDVQGTTLYFNNVLSDSERLCLNPITG